MAEVTDERVRELLTAEERFQLVAESVDEVILVAAADLSRIEYANPAYEDVYGQPVDRLYDRPRSFLESVHPADREAYEDDLTAMLEDFERGCPDRVYEGEYRLVPGGGDEGEDETPVRWVNVTRYPVREEGSVTRYVGVVKDVTERREFERTYREVFENVSDGLVVHDPKTGEILDVNDRYCELTGYAREELVGEDIGLIIPSDSAYSFAGARERIQRAREEGSQLFEWKGERADGTTFDAEVHLSVVEIRGRERVLASVRDITERKRREREYEQIFDGVSDVIVVIDPDTYQIVDANAAFEAMVGYDREEIRERGIAGLSATEEGYTESRGRQVIDRVMESGEPETLEWKAETADGEQRWLEVKATPATVGGERRYLAIQRDVTERRHRERLVRALHASTERIQDAGTKEAVCTAVVEAAEEVLDLSMPACWLAEGGAESTVLEPAAISDRAREVAGVPRTFEPGTVGHRVYESGETTVYDPREYREEESPLEAALLLPLGDHGLLGVAEPGVEGYDDVTHDGARILARHATAALDRVERERERWATQHRLERVAERVDEVVYMANPDMTEVEYVSPGYEEIWGLPRERLREDPFSFVEGIHPDDREDYRDRMESMREDLLAGDARDRYEFEYRVRRPDGEVRFVEAAAYPLRDADGEVDGLAGLIRDVTAEERRQETLSSFHEATRELTEAGSRKSASRRAVEAAAEALGFGLVSVHLFDEGEGTLRPVAGTETLEERLDFLPSFGPGDSVPWQVFVDGEPGRPDAVASADVYGPGVPDPDLVLPLGPHGVMLVGTPEREFDTEVVDLAQILAATLEAALNHVRGRRELEEREAELREHRERAERLERLNTVIREIEQATVEGSSREEIERAVCEQLTTVESYRVAWTADANPGRDALVTRESAGESAGYADTLAIDLGGDDHGHERHPAAAAFDSGTAHSVRGLATSTTAEWRKPALRAGYQALLAVPLVYEEARYGVLCIAADDPAAFDGRTVAVLEELGRSVGYAVSVLERRAALESDTTTELEFELDDDGPFPVRLSAATDARVELERTVRQSGGSFGAFYTVEGVDPDRAVEAARSVPDVAAVHVVTAAPEEGTCLVEVTTPDWFGRPVADHGGVVRTATAEAGSGRVVAEVPRGADVRTLVESFQDRYPGTELTAQRTRERAVQTLLELRDALEDRLTPRQREALETAYSAGYFDWPRESSGEDVADLLEVTQPTFNKHLRTAERKTFSMLLERGPGSSEE